MIFDVVIICSSALPPKFKLVYSLGYAITGDLATQIIVIRLGSLYDFYFILCLVFEYLKLIKVDLDRFSSKRFLVTD